MNARKPLGQYSKQKEDAVKEFWVKKKIYSKAKKAGEKCKKNFYLMDGPPYATGYIHMGTALNKISKDVAIRAKRMQGYNVFDRAGYDTHGVPIESKVEQKLGFKTKQDIEDYGVKKFVEECRNYATQFIGVQNAEFFDLGAWLDYEDPYLTLSNEYINALWWTFKKADEKGLLCLGKYPVHVCAHCETAVSFNEIEYTKQTDTSVYVKFKVKGADNKYLIIWTTTPWTLPGDTGVMAHPNFDYVEAKMGNGETWIVAKERLQQLIDAIQAGYSIEREFKGKELDGTEYENPLTPHLAIPEKELKGGYRVIMSERYVNLEDGTGLVHSAPGHGKEDFDAGTKAGLPVLSPIEMNGMMTEEAGKYAGKKARVVDEEIISDLEAAGALVYKHPFTHDYPICWRCKQPLLMMSVPQWFIKVSAIQPRLLELNETVYWVPDWMKARMKNWIDSLSDWPVSRARYWGTALPIWVCEKCSEKTVVGSIAELEKLAGRKVSEVHKPEIDEVTIPCKKCNGTMKRTPEVLDVWFDAGASSWAALQYPARTDLFKKFWPADLNLEGTDQVRGWWNAELIQSVICFDDKPFKAIAVHGLVLDLGKQKMSKSKGNIVAPKDVIEKHNRDFLRYYLIQNSRGTDLVFDWEAFSDVQRFFNTLWNSLNYANTYLKIDLQKAGKAKMKGLQTEDKWLLSKTSSLAETALRAYNDYEFYKALVAIEYFVTEELSRTYIKLVRDRVGTKTEKAVATTLSFAIDSLLKLLAPCTPHIVEYFYQHLKNKKMPESIHLLQLPVPNRKLIDLELEKEMEKAKALNQAVLALREEQKLRLRWPLKELVLVTKSGKEFKKALQAIKKTANVKKISEAKAKPKGKFAEKEFEGTIICLNIEADAGLRDEWELQELRRRIQEKRKEAKLQPNQKAVLLIACSDEKFLKKFGKLVEKETNTKLKAAQGKMEKLLEREFFIELQSKK